MNYIKKTALIVASAAFSALCSIPSYGQTTQSNPLVRPNLKAPEVAPSNLPPVPVPGKNSGESGATSKAAQEEFALRNQQLNAERVPLPLRLLLASVYVTAISGDTAILRQPLPMTQQAALFAQGNTVAGAGLPGAAPGMNPQLGQIPGQAPFGSNMAMGMGQITPLSSPTTGSLNNQLQPPIRPITIKVVNNKVLNLQGFALKATVTNNSVILTLQDNLNNPVVFQSGLESASSPQFVPAQNALERTDNSYFDRVQAKGGATGSQSGSGPKP